MEALREVAGAPKPVGPYSAAILVGNTVYCSGQLGLDPQSGAFIDNTVEGQTRQIMKNLDTVLRAAGSSWNKVVMTTIFLTEIADGKVVNPIYAEFVSADAPPARQTVAVKTLPMNALVEISVIAVR